MENSEKKENELSVRDLQKEQLKFSQETSKYTKKIFLLLAWTLVLGSLFSLFYALITKAPVN